MYEPVALLALFAFIYSVIAGRVERSIVSGPIIFVAFGFIIGPMVLGWVEPDVTNKGLRILADFTLALILFIDAANADLSILKRQIQIPSRMLLIGLPGVLLLGFGVAVWLFPEIGLFEAAVLATMLAATDAALGKAVITNKLVPVRIREGLNAESGLNDGLCVPILLVFIALALSTGGEGESSMSLTLRLVAQELGIGLAVGLGLAALGGIFIDYCWKKGWVSHIWLQVTVVAIAFASFALAQSLHGSGYIAAFTGGMLFGFLAKEHTHDLVLAAEGAGRDVRDVDLDRLWRRGYWSVARVFHMAGCRLRVSEPDGNPHPANIPVADRHGRIHVQQIVSRLVGLGGWRVSFSRSLSLTGACRTATCYQ